MLKIHKNVCAHFHFKPRSCFGPCSEGICGSLHWAGEFLLNGQADRCSLSKYRLLVFLSISSLLSIKKENQMMFGILLQKLPKIHQNHCGFIHLKSTLCTKIKYKMLILNWKTDPDWKNVTFILNGGRWADSVELSAAALGRSALIMPTSPPQSAALFRSYS